MILRQAVLQDLSLDLHQLRDLAQEPFVDGRDLVNFVHGQALAQGLCHNAQPVLCRHAQRIAQIGFGLECDIVQAGQACLQ